MTQQIALRAREKKWTIAYQDDSEQWSVCRVHGRAFGRSPEAAVAWAYADNGQPAELYATRREALEQIAERFSRDAEFEQEATIEGFVR